MTGPRLGTNLKLVQRLIEEDEDTLALFREQTIERRGRPTRGARENSDNITIYPPRGTGRAYTLDRLKREQPDLFAEVSAKRLSANAAAIKAGFRKSPTPLIVLRRAWKRASAEDRETFRREIAAS